MSQASHWLRSLLVALATSVTGLIVLASTANATTLYYVGGAAASWDDAVWAESSDGTGRAWTEADQGADVVFNSKVAPGVTIGTMLPQVNSMTVDGGGVDIGGNVLTLVGAGRWGGAAGAGISCPVAGTVGLTRQDAGYTVLWQATNTYTGTTTINSGAVLANGDASLGDPANGVFLSNGGLLKNFLADVPMAATRTITLGTGGGQLMAGWGANMTVNGKITGAGPLTIGYDSGIVHLAGSNDYTGSTTVSGEMILADTGSLLFDINSSGDSTHILGDGWLTLNGTLKIDGNGVTSDGSWTLIPSTLNSMTYGATFGLAMIDGTPFTASGSTWSCVDKGYHWSFADGVLSVDVPEPSVMALLATGLLGLVAYAWRRRK